MSRKFFIVLFLLFVILGEVRKLFFSFLIIEKIEILFFIKIEEIIIVRLSYKDKWLNFSYFFV